MTLNERKQRKEYYSFIKADGIEITYTKKQVEELLAEQKRLILEEGDGVVEKIKNIPRMSEEGDVYTGETKLKAIKIFTDYQDRIKQL